jgi:hypothetical protein
VFGLLPNNLLEKSKLEAKAKKHAPETCGMNPLAPISQSGMKGCATNPIVLIIS